jgi:hypothetical protein
MMTGFWFVFNVVAAVLNITYYATTGNVIMLGIGVANSAVAVLLFSELIRE